MIDTTSPGWVASYDCFEKEYDLENDFRDAR